MRRYVVTVILVGLLSTLAPFGTSPAAAAFYGGSGTLTFDRFSPNAGDGSERQWDIFAARPERRVYPNLTSSAVVHETSGVWSPDGRSLAYVRAPTLSIEAHGSAEGFAQGFSHGSSIVIANANGDPRRELLRSDDSEGAVTTVAWSPDGTHLVYTRNWLDGDRFVKGQLETIRLRDGRVRELFVLRDGMVQSPQWSPDGSKILIESVLERYRANGTPDLLMVGMDGEVVGLGGRRILGWWPTWTPEGEILYPSIGTQGVNCPTAYVLYNGCTDIWVSDIWGRNPRRILSGAPYDLEGDGWHEHLWRPRLSPDGRKLAIIVSPDYWKRNTQSYRHQLWVWDLASGTAEKLADHAPLLTLDWRPECTLRGTKGADVLVGTSGRDLICGLGGNDVIHGRGGDDVVFGHGGDDMITGGDGRDIVVGSGGNDRCEVDRKDHSRVC